MEASVRHLRDGALPDAAVCATCCVLDNLSIIGGTLVLRHAVQLFIAAMRQGRSQATSLRLVDLTGAFADVATSTTSIRRIGAHPDARPTPERGVELIDLFSDPWGWRQLATTSPSSDQPAESGTSVPAGTVFKPAPQSLAVGLSALQEELLRPPQLQSHPSSQYEKTGGAPASPPDSKDGNDAGAASATATAATAGGLRSVCIVISCFSTLMERYGDWQALALLEAVQRSPVVSCVLTSLHTDLHPAQLVFALRRFSSCWVVMVVVVGMEAGEAAEEAVCWRLRVGWTVVRSGERLACSLFCMCPWPAAGAAWSGPAAGGGGQQALGHILYIRDSASEADSDQELDEDLDI
ncbi:hypothetical protein VOLCADRAFT_91021 [Volvox carteri f. nagariensis]|uniref:Elongator complex protein 5 n=1 Tax=Volvox carteri f. nagariensis TaxID=3068 RepID=D8TVZ2_VOLCA|nr:uncharacterized protein VOLCADRAFT_91021 [Volvox carteri f. nagariensis]EFJ48278.1 hypothetical protein VOLCADRAFT_91021 [Volvox carteri f. nagariensis]|eukprot:XP_002950532.1 hypothetical protein VOLCADRAFT_91021 [Volvox carteri f. nagariensis]